MLELMRGRPETNEGRLEKEIRVYDLLDSLALEYDRIDHEEAMTMEVCADIDAPLGQRFAKISFFVTVSKPISIF